MSDRAKLKEKIEELEQKYKVIAENLVDALWVMDLETLDFDYVTPSLETLSGYTPEEFAGLNMEDKMTPESFSAAKEKMEEHKRLFLAGSPRRINMELEMTHREGHSYWVDIVGRIFQSEDGRLKVAGVSKDITSRKTAEKEKEVLILELNRTLAEKDKLLKELKILRGLLPICAGCKRIRDSQGRWWPLEAYVERHSEASLSHTICPDCKEVYYGLDDK